MVITVLLLKLFKSPVVCLAGLVSMCPPISASTIQGDWLGRLMVLKVTPLHISSDIQGIHGEVYTPDVLIPGMDLSYFMTDNWAVELQGGRFVRSYSIKNSAVGNFMVGNIGSTTVSLTIQYHFDACSLVKPYLGLGVNYARVHDIEPAAGIPNFEVRDMTSGIINAGADLKISENWFFSASMRYVLSPAYSFHGDSFSANVKMDTLIYGVGIGILF